MWTRATVPQWAVDLVNEVCTARRRRPAHIRSWMVKNNRPWSTGFCRDDDRSICIVQGFDEVNARTVLVHELAHYLTPVNHDHDKLFWRRCWELHLAYSDLADAWRCESTYMKKAITYAPPSVLARFAGPIGPEATSDASSVAL